MVASSPNTPATAASLYQLAFCKPATYFVSVQMNHPEQLMFDYFELKSPHLRPSHPRKDQWQSETSLEATKDY